MHITNAGQRYYTAASKLVRARLLHCVQVALNCHILEIQDDPDGKKNVSFTTAQPAALAYYVSRDGVITRAWMSEGSLTKVQKWLDPSWNIDSTTFQCLGAVLVKISTKLNPLIQNVIRHNTVWVFNSLETILMNSYFTILFFLGLVLYYITLLYIGSYLLK